MNVFKSFQVAFDTNAIISELPAQLISRKALDAIAPFNGQFGAHASVKVRWWLPQVVAKEREYQMKSAARSMAKEIANVEQLLERTTALNEAMLLRAVEDRIRNDLELHRFEVLPLDENRVDWQDVIERAVARKPPFETKTEKGFRDAMIAESFFQLLGNTCSADDCYIMVTKDKLLTRHINDRHAFGLHVEVIEDVDKLLSRLRAASVNLTEDEVRQLCDLAKRYLNAAADDPSSVSERMFAENIRRQHQDRLFRIGLGATSTELGDIHFERPTFADKLGDRVSFFSPAIVTIHYKGFQPWDEHTLFAHIAHLEGHAFINPSEIYSVDHRFLVQWSATLQDSTLVDATLTECRYRESHWHSRDSWIAEGPFTTTTTTSTTTTTTTTLPPDDY